MWVARIIALVACFGDSQPSIPQEFKLVDKSIVRKGGGADFIAILEKKILTVDSKCEVNLWHFDNSAKLNKITSLPVGWFFRSFDYCSFTKCFALSNSNTENNVIFFYSLKDHKEFAVLKKYSLESKFKFGPTMVYRFSPQGTLFAYSSFCEKSIEILDTKNYKVLLSLPYREYVDSLFFLEERLLLSVSSNDEAIIWDLSNNKPKILRKLVIPKQERRVLDMKLDKAEKRLVLHYSLEGNKLGFSIIDLNKDFTVSHFETPVEGIGGISISKLSPKNNYVVVGNSDSELRVINSKTGKVLSVHKLNGVPTSIEFFEGNDSFAVGCMSGFFYMFSGK